MIIILTYFSRFAEKRATMSTSKMVPPVVGYKVIFENNNKRIGSVYGLKSVYVYIIALVGAGLSLSRSIGLYRWLEPPTFFWHLADEQQWIQIGYYKDRKKIEE